MSRRNLILLIIILALAVLSVFGFLYFNQSTAVPGESGTGTNFISDFNPFGTSTPTPPAPAPAPIDISNSNQNPVSESQNSRLVRISNLPIAGFTVYMKERFKDVPVAAPIPITQNEDGSIAVETAPVATTPVPPPTEFAPALRYVEKSTGNIYQTFVDKIDERKFSDTTIPKIYDAYFGNSGQSVVMRYLKPDGKTIETFVGALPKELLGGDTTPNNELQGSFLPNNVRDISLSPNAAKIFYLFNSGVSTADGIIGTTLNFLDNKKIQVFDSPFTEWLSAWPTERMITLTTKPSATIPGFMYTLDPTSKSFSKVLGDINGLTTLASPNGKLILYADNNLTLSVYHTDTRNSDTLGIKTLPEKCAWGRGSSTLYCAVPTFISTASYPDSWYQGEISFSDQLWRVDVSNLNSTLLFDPTTISNGGDGIDGTKLALDETENSLFLINKKDSLLWKLDLR